MGGPRLILVTKKTSSAGARLLPSEPTYILSGILYRTSPDSLIAIAVLLKRVSPHFGKAVTYSEFNSNQFVSCTVPHDTIMAWTLFGATEEAEAGQAPVKPEEGTQTTVEEALECDYERNCITLYKKIEEEEFEDVIRFLNSGYWPGTFFADGTSPADQARTWVTRFDPNDQKKVRWSQLPIHLAIVVDAPLAILRQLLELYPQGVRCTDDQHMLPLHLALRHGSPDKVIDHLLSLFPESVNAPGKGDRTAVEIALRGPNKVRGRIIDVFLKYTKKEGKFSGEWYAAEMALLKEELAVKANELDDTKSKLVGLETAKLSSELDLRGKIEELEKTKAGLELEASRKVEGAEGAKVVEVFESNQKIEGLERALAMAEDNEKRAREAETKAQSDLSSLHRKVVNASPDELAVIKSEITKLKKQRLKESKKLAKEELDALESQINDDIMSVSSSMNKEELRSIRSTVGELRTLGARAKSFDDINSFRVGVESVRDELKAKEEVAKTQEEVDKLKRTLEQGLKEADEKQKREMEEIKKTVDRMAVAELDTKTNEEIKSLKAELSVLRKEVIDKELLDNTKKHYESLKKDLDTQLAESQGVTQRELAEMKKSVDKLNVDRIERSPDTDLISVKKELQILREQLDEKEEASRTRLELTILRKALEAELKDKDGKTQEELKSIKAAVASVNKRDLDTRTNDELIALKSDVAMVKSQLQMKEDAQATIKELTTVKATLEEQMDESDARTKKELSIMKASVEAIDASKIQEKNREELDTLRKEVSSVKAKLQDNEEVKELRVDLQSMRSTLSTMMTSEGKTKNEMKAMKAAVKTIGDKELKSKTKEELSQLKADVETLKVQVQSREEVTRDLTIARESIEKQLATQNDPSGVISLKTRAEELESRSIAAGIEDMKDVKNDAITLKIQALAAEADHDVSRQDAMVSEIMQIKKSIEQSLGSPGAKASKDTAKTRSTLAAVTADSLKEKDFGELETLLGELKTLQSNNGSQKKKSSLIKTIARALGLSKKQRASKQRTAKKVDTIAPPSGRQSDEVEEANISDTDESAAKENDASQHRRSAALTDASVGTSLSSKKVNNASIKSHQSPSSNAESSLKVISTVDSDIKSVRSTKSLKSLKSIKSLTSKRSTKSKTSAAAVDTTEASSETESTGTQVFLPPRPTITASGDIEVQ